VLRAFLKYMKYIEATLEDARLRERQTYYRMPEPALGMGVKRGMSDDLKLKTQTGYMLSLHDVRKAAAAYELMYEAAEMLTNLPIPVMEGLRDYAKDQLKSRKGKLVLCERAFVEHLTELIMGARHREKLLFQGITGLPDADDKKKQPPTAPS